MARAGVFWAGAANSVYWPPADHLLVANFNTACMSQAPQDIVQAKGCRLFGGILTSSWCIS
jgi:hypothetical protein